MALAVAPLAAQNGSAAPEAREGSDAIRPGDIVRLTVFRSDSLSGEFPVNQFGTVVLPLIGEYDVSRETHKSLRDRVIHDLREVRYAPAIEVVVLKKVRVLGAVNEPGVYTLDPTMTIADAVAMARGRTDIAREGDVLLRRGADVIDADLRLETLVSESPIRSGDEIFVPRTSWLSRNMTAAMMGASTLAGIIVTLIVQ
jgi:polysaccharide export outer membrane protein